MFMTPRIDALYKDLSLSSLISILQWDHCRRSARETVSWLKPLAQKIPCPPTSSLC